MVKHLNLWGSLFGGSVFLLGFVALLASCVFLPFYRPYATLSGWALASQAIVDVSYLLSYLALTLAGGFLLFLQGNHSKVVDLLFLAFAILTCFGYFFDYAAMVAYYRSLSNGEGMLIALPMHTLMPFGYLAGLGIAFLGIGLLEKRSPTASLVLKGIGIGFSLCFYIYFLGVWALIDTSEGALAPLVFGWIGGVLFVITYLFLILDCSFAGQDLKRNNQKD